MKQHLFTTELFNDGSTPDESNCKIEWNNNIAVTKVRLTMY
ncbi:hypothetical protein [Clostridium sp. ZS2-4]|nr:hypothetical protein [Clostridium sp. ZS2-4]MCY6356336.1 hypothetical protein [Clostridium sp. ZS2-4]